MLLKNNLIFRLYKEHGIIKSFTIIIWKKIYYKYETVKKCNRL